MAIALVVWLSTAKGLYGEITVTTLSDQWVSFAGNAAAIISGGVLSVGLSLWRPANFDWEKTRNMKVAGNEESSISTSNEDVKEQDLDKKEPYSPNGTDAESDGGEVLRNADGLDLRALQHTFKLYGIIFIVLALIITFVSSLGIS